MLVLFTSLHKRMLRSRLTQTTADTFTFSPLALRRLPDRAAANVTLHHRAPLFAPFACCRTSTLVHSICRCMLYAAMKIFRPRLFWAEGALLICLNTRILSWPIQNRCSADVQSPQQHLPCSPGGQRTDARADAPVFDCSSESKYKSRYTCLSSLSFAPLKLASRSSVAVAVCIASTHSFLLFSHSLLPYHCCLRTIDTLSLIPN